MQDILGKTYQDDADYYDAANFVVGTDITAFVEGLEDEIFWSDVFSKFAPSLKIKFESHSRNNEYQSGVQAVLKEKDKVGKHLILCIDSDFRYLLQDPEINNNPYIFQTYTYAIENHKCAPKNLNRIIKQATLLKGEFDFVTFLEKYSQTIYTIFLYILYFEKRKYDQIQNGLSVSGEELVAESKLIAVLGIPSHEVEIEDNAQLTLATLETRVRALEEEIIAQHGVINLAEVECYLQETLNIDKSDIFWYINGHLLYENVIGIVLGKVISAHKRQTRKKYESLPQTQVVKDKHREYKNYLKAIQWETLLATNHLQGLAFDDSCPLMAKIKEDIRAFSKRRGEINGNGAGRWLAPNISL